MKVLICGSRNITDPTLISQAVSQSGITPTHLISGGARGVDRLAAEYAVSRGIGFTEFRRIGTGTGNVLALSAIMQWSEQPMQSLPCGMAQAPVRSIRSNSPDRAGNGFSFT